MTTSTTTETITGLYPDAGAGAEPVTEPAPEAATELVDERPVALVTGASRGIGRAIAHELGTTHRVLVGGTDPETVSEVVAELPDAAAFVGDLTDPDVVASLTAGIDSLDVLVHSAGLASYVAVEDAGLSQWRDLFELNVFAVAELTRRLLPALRTAQGTVIAINSGAGFTSGAKYAIYAGTKFALRAFTDALREEERGRVRVSSIHPGRVDTQMQQDLQESMGNRAYDGSLYLTPEAVAATVRTVVDAPANALVQEISIRPV